MRIKRSVRKSIVDPTGFIPSNAQYIEGVDSHSERGISAATKNMEETKTPSIIRKHIGPTAPKNSDKVIVTQHINK